LTSDCQYRLGFFSRLARKSSICDSEGRAGWVVARTGPRLESKLVDVFLAAPYGLVHTHPKKIPLPTRPGQEAPQWHDTRPIPSQLPSPSLTTALGQIDMVN
jgi:hypothetical protein